MFVLIVFVSLSLWLCRLFQSLQALFAVIARCYSCCCCCCCLSACLLLRTKLKYLKLITLRNPPHKYTRTHAQTTLPRPSGHTHTQRAARLTLRLSSITLYKYDIACCCCYCCCSLLLVRPNSAFYCGCFGC